MLQTKIKQSKLRVMMIKKKKVEIKCREENYEMNTQTKFPWLLVLI